MPSENIYTVFVSSTYEDLREERAEVQKALLKLGCMPIGMELFGSADEDTWEFIKRQIAESDYYVVVLADRYGSLAPDGVSYTEKEYDYAREIQKPILAFVHGNRGGIPRHKTETDPQKRQQLDAFIQKIGQFPISKFTSPSDLAAQVTVSFVNLRDRRPAVGFIRADRAPDLKRYAELLEENSHLRDEIAKLSNQAPVPFENSSDVITLAAEDKEKNRHERSMSLKKYFVTVGTLILRGKGEEQDLSIALLWGIFRGVGYPVLWAEASVPFTQSLFLLFAKGLIDVEHTLIEVEEEDMFGFMNTKSIFKSSDSTPSRRKVQKQQSSWKLTD